MWTYFSPFSVNSFFIFLSSLFAAIFIFNLLFIFLSLLLSVYLFIIGMLLRYRLTRFDLMMDIHEKGWSFLLRKLTFRSYSTLFFRIINTLTFIFFPLALQLDLTD